MVDVTNDEELKAWLDKQPHHTKIAIGTRAALRVLPVALLYAISSTQGRSWTKSGALLSCFRSYLLGCIASLPRTEVSYNKQIQITEIAATLLEATERADWDSIDGGRDSFGAGLTADAVRAAYFAVGSVNSDYNLLETINFALKSSRELPEVLEQNTAQISTLTAEIEYCEGLSDTSRLWERPLWSNDAMPDYWEADLHSFEITEGHPKWAFWIEWYQGVLDGKPLDWDLQRQVALIPDEDWDKGAKHIADCIAEIRQSFTNDSAEIIKLIPDQDEHFRLGWSEMGRLTTLPDNELANEELFHALSQMMLATDGPLETLTTHYQQNNNTPQATLIGPLIAGYAKELAKERSEINFAILYFYGNSVISAVSNAKREQESGEWPEPDAPIATAIDQVCASHGPMIMATTAGQDIVEAAAKFDATPEQNREIGDTIHEVIDIAATEYDLIEPETQQNLDIATQVDGNDPHPDRTAVLQTRIANSTLVAIVGGAAIAMAGGATLTAMAASALGVPTIAGIAAAGGITGSFAVRFIWESFKNSIPGKNAIGAGTEKIDEAWKRLQNSNQQSSPGTPPSPEQERLENSLHLPEYRRMAELVRKNENKFRLLANMRPEFSWVHRAIDWIKQQHSQKDD